VIVAVLILATVYFLRYEAHKRGFHWKVFVNTLAALDWVWLLAAAAFAFATYFVRAVRWAVLLKPLRPQPRFWNLFAATAIGFAAVTLFGRPGEFVRPYLIALKERVPFSSQLAAWGLERIYDLLFALLIFGFGLSRVRGSAADVGPALAWILQVGGGLVAVTGVICLLLLVLIRQYADTMRRRLVDSLGFLSKHHLERAERLVHAFVQGVESTKSSRAVLLLVLYTFLEWLLLAACYVSIIRAFGTLLHFSFVDVLILMGFMSFGAVVQIPGIGGGVQVVAVLVLTELFSVPLEIATSVAMVVWITNFVVIVPFGLAIALGEGLTFRKLKELEREAAS